MQQLISTVLYIRLKQFLRYLHDIGIGLVLLAGVLCLGLLFSLVAAMQQSSDWQIAIIFGICLVVVHLQRGDYQFLRQLLSNPSWLFLIEYTSIIILLALFLLPFGKYYVFPFSIPFIILLSIWPPPNRLGAQKPWLKHTVLPLWLWEWRSGLRRSGLLFFSLYLICLGLSFLIGASLLGILVSGFVISSSYDYIEPPVILEQWLITSYSLPQKIFRHAGAFLILTLPFSVAYLIFHAERWYLLPLFLLAAMLMITFAICYKYAIYLPHQLRAYHQNALSLFALGLLIPLFLPGSLIYLVVYYRKAQKRLAWFYPVLFSKSLTKS
ncbi:MAG: hypothetical protein MRY78_06695 [Saprospiraceae bacterium]|nr:hypothetical protein [Saprospiraceae bacterium]